MDRWSTGEANCGVQVIYDVAVVGAGPAGSYLSYLLARDGYAVALLDKAEFPRDKVCGGGISNKALELLGFDVSPAVERRIVGAYLTYQNRDTILRDLDGRSGVTVTRTSFDDCLLQRAVSQGARFFPGHRFLSVSTNGAITHIQTSRGRVRARYLAGADGVFSQVRAAAFGRSLVRYAPVLEALVSVKPEVIDRFNNRILLDFGGIARGYGWIFPKHDHLNVGVFSIYGSRDLRSDLHSFMQRYDALRSYTKTVYRGSAIPVANSRGVYQYKQVLLVGDAAGFAESFYGEGIYFALKSAALAHRALTTQADGGAEEQYARLVASELAPDLKYSRLNARLFFPRQKFGFYHMVRSVYVNEYFAELIGGGVSHKECFYKTIATSPYWFWSRRYPYVAERF